MNEDIPPITIDMIRKLTPKMITDDIAGVQPMSGIDIGGSEFITQIDTFIKIKGSEVGGMTKKEIIEVLKEHCPENFV